MSALDPSLDEGYLRGSYRSDNPICTRTPWLGAVLSGGPVWVGVRKWADYET